MGAGRIKPVKSLLSSGIIICIIAFLETLSEIHFPLLLTLISFYAEEGRVTEKANQLKTQGTSK